MKNSSLIAISALFATALSAQAVTIIGTDFIGRTITGTNGETASNITYTLNGVSNPGDLTVTAASANLGNAGSDLFTTTAAAGAFAPDLNLFGDGNWQTNFNFSVLSSPITLESLDMGGLVLTNTGALQGGNAMSNRVVTVQLTITGSTSGTLLGGTAGQFDVVHNTSTGTASVATGLGSLNFADFAITSAETWTVQLDTVSSGGSALNFAVDSFALNGTVVPEPSSLLLSGLGLCGMLVLRRRK